MFGESNTAAKNPAVIAEKSIDVERKTPRERKKLPVINKDFRLEKYNWHRLRRIVRR